MAKEKTNWLAYIGKSFGAALGFTTALLIAKAFGLKELSTALITIEFVMVLIFAFLFNLIFDKLSSARNRSGKTTTLNIF